MFDLILWDFMQKSEKEYLKEFMSVNEQISEYILDDALEIPLEDISKGFPWRNYGESLQKILK